MFGLFSRKPKQEIFRYWDGCRWRGADPLLVFRQMIGHPRFDLEKHSEWLRIEDVKIQMEAVEITVDAMRSIFGLQPWNEETGRGVTDREVLGILSDFIIYTANLKKNGSGQQTWQGATEPPSLGVYSQTTNASSDSGSTSTESTCETPLEHSLP